MSIQLNNPTFGVIAPPPSSVHIMEGGGSKQLLNGSGDGGANPSPSDTTQQLFQECMGNTTNLQPIVISSSSQFNGVPIISTVAGWNGGMAPEAAAAFWSTQPTSEAASWSSHPAMLSEKSLKLAAAIEDPFDTEWSSQGSSQGDASSAAANNLEDGSESSLEKDWSSQGGNVEVDQTPLQNQLQKNKESLELKLQLRRPMTALVEQGIMPQYKTSPSLHAQRTKLERAQMGDKLRQKIASRPDRQELVHRHILEDVRPDVDPSLCSRQRQLKRAKLADSLATQLSHRPGPLELIQKNILHTDDPVEQLVKQGSIAFTPTALGTPVKPGASLPPEQITAINTSSAIQFLPPGEDDSGDGVPSPQFILPKSPPSPASTQQLELSVESPQLPDLALLTGAPSSKQYSLDSGFSPSAESLIAESQRKDSRSESVGDISHLTPSQIQLISQSNVFAPSTPSATAPTKNVINNSVGDDSGVLSNSTVDSGLLSNSTVDSGLLSNSTVLITTSNNDTSTSTFMNTRPLTSTPFSSLHELQGPSLQREAPGKDRKKMKLKKPSTAPKPRTIKFHEYKGPEMSLKRKIDEKGGSGERKGSGQSETAYDLLLKQQQLFLQWQLENQNKYPQILLPATSRSSLMSLGSSTSPSLIGSSSVSLNSSSQASSCAASPGSSRPSTPRSSTPIRSMILTPQDVNHATSLLNRLDDVKVMELKIELKKRGLVVSGPKPVLIDRLRPVLEEIIAAGRQQFQQPYKQISIPKGGLIILKPSPNSQILTRTEQTGNDNQQVTVIGNMNGAATPLSIAPPATPLSIAPSTPQSMHEGTPELMNGEDSPMTPVSNCASFRERDSSTPFSPVNMRSPANSVVDEGVDSHDSPRPALIHSNSMDLDLNLNLMEMETGHQKHAAAATPSPMIAPPPPPPPPPPTAVVLSEARHPSQVIVPTSVVPAPLPAPPAAVSVQQQNRSTVLQQFVPPQKTNQQIMFAKQQLETHLAGSQGINPSRPTGPVRAGPKGQFIWPPVSVQSAGVAGGTVTIRASRSIGGTSTAQTVTTQAHHSQVEQSAEVEQMSSSTPVAQLAAVFSVGVSSAPVFPPPTTGLYQSSSAPNLKVCLAPVGSVNQGNVRSQQIQESPATTRINISSLTSSASLDNPNICSVPAGIKLTRSGSVQLPSTFQIPPPNLIPSSSGTNLGSIQLGPNLPPNVRLPQEPIPASELGLIVKNSSTLSNSMMRCESPLLPATLPVVSSVARPQVCSQPNETVIISTRATSVPVSSCLVSSSCSNNVNSSLGFQFQQDTRVPVNSVQNMCTVSTLQPGYSIVPSNSMPAVVNSEQAVVSARMDDSEGHQLLQMPAADGSDNENIIQKQQKQIEDLTRALERSRQQLIETQNQQQTSGKVQISRQLQKRQLTNQIHQLQNQIVSKAQQQKAVVSAVLQNNSQKEDMSGCDDQFNQSIDQFLDSILKNGFHEEGSAKIAPPPPPPPPLNTAKPSTSSSDGSYTAGGCTPTTPVAPAFKDLHLPQLDFGDLSFDLGQLPDLGGWTPDKNGWVVGAGGDPGGTGGGGKDWLESSSGGGDESMDVDMDVADWLDSLLPPVNGSGSSGM